MERYNFLLELFRNVGNFKPFGVRHAADDQVLIYELDLVRPSGSTYWTDWGGWYDNPISTALALFFDVALTQRSSYALMLANPNSFFIDGRKLYYHVPRFPWLYDRASMYLSEAEMYTTSAIDQTNPSLPVISESASGYEYYYKTTLFNPSYTMQISNIINGITLQQQYSVSLDNSDGFFDKNANEAYLNRIARLKKVTTNNPDYTDFVSVLEGLVENIKVSWERVTFTIADKFRNLDDPVCRIITTDDFPTAPTASQGKKIPIGYGDFYGVDVIQVGTSGVGEYMVLDATYLTAVNALYDSSGVALNPLNYTPNFTTGVIAVSAGNAPATADVTGRITGTPPYGNRVGDIITAEMTAAGYAYGPASTTWDYADTQPWLTASNNRVDFWFDGKSYKELLEDVLKNDMIFLIVKTDGLFTVRDWSRSYTTHNMKNHNITAISKNFRDNKYYASTVNVQWGNGYSQNDTYEVTAFNFYGKEKRLELETTLTTASEADKVSAKVARRFYRKREIVEVSLGQTTQGIELLDEIQFQDELGNNEAITINGRKFSEYSKFRVIGMNPAQDKLTLEDFE